jgi:hypothetical protein
MRNAVLDPVAMASLRPGGKMKRVSLTVIGLALALPCSAGAQEAPKDHLNLDRSSDLARRPPDHLHAALGR